MAVCSNYLLVYVYFRKKKNAWKETTSPSSDEEKEIILQP